VKKGVRTRSSLNENPALGGVFCCSFGVFCDQVGTGSEKLA